MPKQNHILLARRIDASILALEMIKVHIDELIRRGKHVARDGHPSGHAGGIGGSDISRPTENAAIGKPMHDPTAQAINEILRSIDSIHGDANRGAYLTAQVIGAQSPHLLELDTDPHCANPNCQISLTGQGPNGRGIGGRCRPCYDYKRGNVDDMDASAELVARRTQRKEQVA